MLENKLNALWLIGNADLILPNEKVMNDNGFNTVYFLGSEDINDFIKNAETKIYDVCLIDFDITKFFGLRPEIEKEIKEFFSKNEREKSEKEIYDFFNNNSNDQCLAYTIIKTRKALGDNIPIFIIGDDPGNEESFQKIGATGYTNEIQSDSTNRIKEGINTGILNICNEYKKEIQQQKKIDQFKATLKIYKALDKAYRLESSEVLTQISSAFFEGHKILKNLRRKTKLIKRLIITNLARAYIIAQKVKKEDLIEKIGNALYEEDKYLAKDFSIAYNDPNLEKKQIQSTNYNDLRQIRYINGHLSGDPISEIRSYITIYDKNQRKKEKRKHLPKLISQ